MADQECAVETCPREATRRLRYTPVDPQAETSVESLCRTHYLWRRVVEIGGGITVSVVLFGTLFFWDAVYLPGPRLIMQVIQSLLLAFLSLLLWGAVVSVIERRTLP